MPIKPVPPKYQCVILLPVQDVAHPLGPQLHFFETDPGDTFACILAFEQGAPIVVALV